MIDLSPQPQDKGSGSGAAHPAPGSDPVRHEREERKRVGPRWLPTHDVAEGAVRRLSRWAGPVALLATLCLLGWWIIH
ncbi:hypothetical protein [Sphingobium sp.]|uniref:hypothetical protein n=1 Tax=Sphingobium sp. TaxID=1912891 RepID=UPI0028BEA9C6|nr:hypothetical protein [Sphingobium sp.]